ncbi:fumarylacetoacetate hydrolase family protein [Candidatus Rariloculus sp.]|uniref:fumarylacetoacetate hydrolase family protein n=1 Tax=Candidatus Rariloculus sp. TaxID=3101265 RepID=UPI003D0B06BA
MRLLSFRSGDHESFGVVADGGVIDAGVHLPGRVGTLKAAIAGDRFGAVAELAAGAEHDYALDEIEFLPTIPDPGKIVCIGINYGNRNEEYRDGSAAPRYPSVFMRTPDSIVGHEQAIQRPPESEQLDYEGEVVLVIGKRGRRIAAESAWDHIAGLTLMNEGSVRDWLRHGKFNVTQGKNFSRSGSLGPWLVTADKFHAPDALHLTTRVNGELRQDDTTANLKFPFSYLIAYLSTFMTLNPGDLIATGTPAGAGARFDPPRYLRAGDIVEVNVPEIGTLRNRVEDELVDPGR